MRNLAAQECTIEDFVCYLFIFVCITLNKDLVY